MKLEKAITFKISKREADFIDHSIKRYKQYKKMDVSKSNFIRYSINMWREYRDIQEYQLAIRSVMEDHFNVKNNIKIKKGRRSKEECKSNSELYMPINIPIRVMMSKEDRDFIDDQVKFFKETHNIKISKGDFIRFCIHRIIDSINLENTRQELKEKKTNV